MQLGRQDPVHTARQSQVTLAGAQALTGQVNGDQRRRTCGIHRHGGARHAEQEGQPSRRGAMEASGGYVGVERLGESLIHRQLASRVQEGHWTSAIVLDQEDVPLNLFRHVLVRGAGDVLELLDVEQEASLPPVEEASC